MNYSVLFIAVISAIHSTHARSFTLSRSHRTSKPLRLKSKIRARSECPVCTPKSTGSLPEAIPEASALAASLRHPDVWYTINDSPQSLQLFALRASGEILSVFDLSGVPLDPASAFGARHNTGDLEAIAVGPCDTGSCIFVGDIGQNCARVFWEDCPWFRPNGSASIMRFPEPEQVQLNGGKATLSGQRFWFQFPKGDGPFDVETLLMTKEGDLFLVTKVNWGDSDLYQLPPLRLNETVVAEHRARVREPSAGSAMFTDGSLHYNGSSIVGVILVTMTHAWYYPVKSGESLPSALAKSACPGLQIDRQHQPQVEGVDWEISQNAFVMLGEKTGSGIVKVQC